MPHRKEVDEAQTVLWTVGAEQFQQPLIADEALQIAIEEWKLGQDLIQASFEIFMELLDDYDRLEQAFSAGIRLIPYRYLHKRVAAIYVDEIAQDVRISAWRSFRDFRAFGPGAWAAWLFMITKNKLNAMLRDMYRAEKHIVTEVDVHEAARDYAHCDRYLEIDRRGWSIPTICTDWISFENEDAKAAFAAQILAMYQGQSGWIGPTGERMCKIVQAPSRSTLYKWWLEFIEEVHRHEGG